jgi:hypothetical protein
LVKIGPQELKNWLILYDESEKIGSMTKIALPTPHIPDPEDFADIASKVF